MLIFAKAIQKHCWVLTKQH